MRGAAAWFKQSFATNPAMQDCVSLPDVAARMSSFLVPQQVLRWEQTSSIVKTATGDIWASSGPMTAQLTRSLDALFGFGGFGIFDEKGRGQFLALACVPDWRRAVASFWL